MHFPMLAGRRLLILEDEQLILIDLETILRDAGAEIFSASTLDTAREIINTEPIDAAILGVYLNSDHPLDGENCQEIADCLRELGIPFAFITGEIEMTAWTRAYQAPILKKPYRDQDVVTVAEELTANVPFPQVNTRPSGDQADL